MLGVTRDEGAFIQLFIDPLLSFYNPMKRFFSIENYKSLLRGILGDESRYFHIVSRHYQPSTKWQKNYNSFIQLLTDYAFYCPSLYVARQLSYFNEVYFYEFNYIPDYLSYSMLLLNTCSKGLKLIYVAACGVDKVCHTFDVPYLYRNVPMFDIEPHFGNATAFEKYAKIKLVDDLLNSTRFKGEQDELEKTFMDQLTIILVRHLYFFFFIIFYRKIYLASLRSSKIMFGQRSRLKSKRRTRYVSTSKFKRG
jgi:hypothetical protein